jgi:hypothetical protein
MEAKNNFLESYERFLRVFLVRNKHLGKFRKRKANSCKFLRKIMSDKVLKVMKI